MKINGKTRVCGLIGNPVEHTLSPSIHNRLAELLEINLVYVPLPVENDRVHTAVCGAKAMNFLGLNVTVPYKSKVIDSLSEIDVAAEEIGAVNTLVSTENGYKGYNTDMPGLKRAMQSDGIILKDKDVVILGAGGVARAVAVLCAKEQVKKLYIINRTLTNSQEILKEISKFHPELNIELLTYDEYDRLPATGLTAIQCTSVGLFPKTEEVVIESDEFYKKISVGYDMIFNPYETKFMKLVRHNGGLAYNGLKMLLYQAVIAFELWNKVSITEEMAMVVYKQLKEESGIHE